MKNERLRISLIFLTTLIAGSAGADEETKIITFPKDQRVQASVTLLARDGNVGRDNPVFNNYRPQMRFSAERSGITCALNIPDPPEKIEPKETVNVSISCVEPFKVKEGKLEFGMVEGGRKVGSGILRP